MRSERVHTRINFRKHLTNIYCLLCPGNLSTCRFRYVKNLPRVSADREGPAKLKSLYFYALQLMGGGMRWHLPQSGETWLGGPGQPFLSDLQAPICNVRRVSAIFRFLCSVMLSCPCASLCPTLKDFQKDFVINEQLKDIISLLDSKYNKRCQHANLQ